MRQRGKILLVDLIRAFCSWRFFVALAAGTAVCFLTLKAAGYDRYGDKDAVYAWLLLHDKSISMLSYLVGTMPYALCFYWDFRRGNYKNMLFRTSVNVYVVSKAMSAFCAAFLAFLGGKLLFVFLFTLKYPFLSGEETLINMGASYQLFYGFLDNEQYWCYFLASASLKALYCGILCLCVMLASLVISGAFMLYSIPIAVFYVVNFYLRKLFADTLFLDFMVVFDGNTRIFASEKMGILYAVLTAAVLFAVLSRGMCGLMRRRIYHG
ncbi:MAG: hypothetical protein Q4C65_05535 [Eubacteriales bacterium]|nr:hypothetical protein [Eubacteriales bacterium]